MILQFLGLNQSGIPFSELKILLMIQKIGVGKHSKSLSS
jgi:hypothetical protein